MDNGGKSSRWARKILEAQHSDGTWGRSFHTLSKPEKGELTTEQALRRLKALGFTLEDEPIRRAVDCMVSCLRGERTIDDSWEKGHNWPLFTRLMLSAWVREFWPEEPLALAFARRWAGVVERTFQGGGCDGRAYREAYEEEFASPIRGGREKDFVDFYHIALLKGVLPQETERRFLDYILEKPEGIYYICEGPLRRPPEEFFSLRTPRYLRALELLGGYRLAKGALGFAMDWLDSQRGADGQWDLGPKARDGISLPLSDSWRKKGARQADCTRWIESIRGRLAD